MSRAELPSPQCSARSTRSGEQCRKRAIRGGTVCGTHGGSAPQVRRQAAARVALAEAAARGKRDPWLVLADALATADVLMVRAREDVTPEPETVDRLIERLELAARLARQLIDSGHVEREVRIAETQGQQLAAAVGRILDALDLTAEQRALVPVVVPRELRRQGQLLAIEGGAA